MLLDLRQSKYGVAMISQAFEFLQAVWRPIIDAVVGKASGVEINPSQLELNS
jgi:hypothetical protein